MRWKDATGIDLEQLQPWQQGQMGLGGFDHPYMPDAPYIEPFQNRQNVPTGRPQPPAGYSAGPSPLESLGGMKMPMMGGPQGGAPGGMPGPGGGQMPPGAPGPGAPNAPPQPGVGAPQTPQGMPGNQGAAPAAAAGGADGGQYAWLKRLLMASGAALTGQPIQGMGMGH